MKAIKTPKSRLELERNIFILFEDSAEKLNSDDLAAKASVLGATLPFLELIKGLPNGRLNMLTIDSAIAMQANIFGS